MTSKAFRVYNKKTIKVEEFLNIKFDEVIEVEPKETFREAIHSTLQNQKNTKTNLGKEKRQEHQIQENLETPRQKFKYRSSNPPKLIIRVVNERMKAKSIMKNLENYYAIIYEIEPSSIEVVLKEES